jgi:hypothetical protein
MGFDIEIKIKDLDISFCSKYWLSVHSTKLFLFILFNFLPKTNINNYFYLFYIAIYK